MARLFVGASVVFLAACGSARDESRAPSPAPLIRASAVSAAGLPDASAPSAASRPIVFPLADPRAPSSPTFHIVLRGPFDTANVHPLPGATFVSWMSGTEQTTIARVADRDLVDLTPVPEDFVGVHGRFPDHAYLTTRTPTRAYQVMNLLRWTNGHWKPLETEASYLGVGPSGAGWLTLTGLGEPFDRAAGARFVAGQDATPPDVLRPSTTYVRLTVFPDGAAVGLASDAGSLSLETVVDGARASLAIPQTENDVLALAGPSARDVYALLRQPESLLHFDGQAWSPVSVEASLGPLLDVRIAPGGEVVLLGERALAMRVGTTFRAVAATTEDAATQEFAEPGESPLSGVEAGAPWMTASGHVRQLAGASWTDVPLPILPPDWSPLVASRVIVVSPTDVWVVASADRGKGAAKATESFVLRTVAPTRELRPGDRWMTRQVPTYSGHETVWADWSARAWPPLADDACATPVLVFAHRASHAAKGSSRSPASFSRTRARVGAKIALQETSWGAETLLIARPATMDDARSFVQMYEEQNATAAPPELVCGMPAR